MFTKDKLNKLLNDIVKAIDISDDLFDKAEDEYTKLGDWIDAETPNYKISIYPQGSFALGTVIKPISDNDDYDLDVVCEFTEQYGLNPKQLKVDVVKPLLVKYNRTSKEIEEKRRCWHVEYVHLPNFHMDIIPAINKSKYIDITEHNEDDNSYDYIGSNPKGYIDWFNSRKQERRAALLEKFTRENREIILCQADVEKIKEYKLKTPLQKAIQLLKRHRDIMYETDETRVKPISIIITTIAANLYNNEDNLVDTLNSILLNAKSYIEQHKINGKYHIDNPSYTGGQKENFADKWNECPEKVDAFFDWLDNACSLFITSAKYVEADGDYANILGMALGDNLIKRVFSEQPDIIRLFEKNTNDVPVALTTYKVRNILSAPHRQPLNMGTPRGTRVVILATATDINGREFKYTNDGPALNKNIGLKFRAVFGGIKPPFDVWWQIVNLGPEASSAKNGLRGGFERSDDGVYIKKESTEYSGSHSIQCFVIKKRQCVAKSDIFIVNIL